MISEQDIDAFQRDGAAVLRGVFTDWVEVIRSGIDRNMANPSEYASENAVTEGRFFDDYCNWPRIPEFERVIRDSPVAELAARAMRRVLVDHARAKATDKRQHQRVTLITQFEGVGEDRIELDALDKALIRLKVIDEEKADIVELRYFGGMSLEEIATVKSTSQSTVKRNWRAARLWLLNSLQGLQG